MTTEEKIKNAAAKLFLKKGYAATRTRDIAEEAEINIALLNYYFRSKKRLFQLIMAEKMNLLFGSIKPILADETIDLEFKARALVDIYSEMLSADDEIALFVLNEIKVNHDLFKDSLMNLKIVAEPVLTKQLELRGIDMNAVDFILNILSLVIFPFIAKNLLVVTDAINSEEFNRYMDGRKESVYRWIRVMLDIYSKKGGCYESFT